MKNCSEVRENISLYIDNALATDERKMFEEHIDACSDCRREFDEIMQIVGLCRDVQEAELPGNFRDELHKKLLEAAGENAGKGNVLQRARYIKMFSSIAAGIVLIFLVSGIYRYAFLSNTKTNDSTGGMSMKTAQAAKPEWGNNGETAEAASNDGADVRFSEAADSAGGQITGMEAPAADRSASSDNRSVQSPKITSAQADETATNRTAMLTVLVDDPAAQVDKIKSIAVQNGGEEQPKALMKSDPMLAAGTAESENVIELAFSIPNKQYGSFTQSLNSGYGQANIQPGELVSEDLTGTLNGYIAESNDIDTQIKKLEDADPAANSSKINELRVEKDKVQDEIENIRLNTDFTTVTIYVKKK